MEVRIVLHLLLQRRELSTRELCSVWSRTDTARYTRADSESLLPIDVMRLRYQLVLDFEEELSIAEELSGIILRVDLDLDLVDSITGLDDKLGDLEVFFLVRDSQELPLASLGERRVPELTSATADLAEGV